MVNTLRLTVQIASAAAAIVTLLLLFQNWDRGSSRLIITAWQAGSGTPWLGAIPPSRPRLDEGPMGPLWVVMTTINPPMATNRILQPGLRDWLVVVVADRKTPQAEWEGFIVQTRLTGRVVFLSMAAQANLGYSVLSVIPENHYSRKNIGYIYAVQHGAEVIYETDDDNSLLLPSPSAAFLTSLTDTPVLVYRPNNPHGQPNRTVVNPYIHFGQPTTWPRGMPLDAVAFNAPEVGYYRLTASEARPLVQQGLANGDPDVDAIFRLTRKSAGTKLRFNFDSSAPPVALPPGLMAPFNSQTTLFHRDALWALLMPHTTPDRVSDIWRGYAIQRLLWCINGSIAFVPPTVFQDRNAHDYFRDLQLEHDLVFEARRLVNFLISWQWQPPASAGTRDVLSAFVALASDMAAAGFWGAREALLAAAWARDLRAVGYTAPLCLTDWSGLTTLGASHQGGVSAAALDGTPSTTLPPNSAAGLPSKDPKSSERAPVSSELVPPGTVKFTPKRLVGPSLDGVVETCTEGVVGPSLGGAQHVATVTNHVATTREGNGSTSPGPFPTALVAEVPIPSGPLQEVAAGSLWRAAAVLSSSEPALSELLRLRALWKGIVLIINYNWSTHASIPFLRVLYGRVFERVVVVSEQADGNLVDYVADVGGIHGGLIFYEALPRVFADHPDARGFMYINDDMVFNYWTYAAFDQDKLWIIPHAPPTEVCDSACRLARNETTPGTGWQDWRQVDDPLYASYHDLPRRLQQQFDRNIGRKPGEPLMYYKDLADYQYIPHRFTDDLSIAATIFARHQAWGEASMITMFACVADMEKDVDPKALGTVDYLWADRRPTPEAYYSPLANGLHPWKPKSASDMIAILAAMSQGDPSLESAIPVVNRTLLRT